VNLEIGPGEHPAAGFDVRVDVLALPGVDVVCRMDRLPFAAGAFGALRANHVLEHQSYELVGETVAEWVRVLAEGASLDIGVPDARCRAASWLAGEIDTAEANYWILGGHSDRPAHRGVDRGGVPRWIWNAHHTLFDPASLHDLLAGCGLADVAVGPEDVCNLRASARKPGAGRRRAEAGGGPVRPPAGGGTRPGPR
jgi:hypothetical protein